MIWKQTARNGKKFFCTKKKQKRASIKIHIFFSGEDKRTKVRKPPQTPDNADAQKEEIAEEDKSKENGDDEPAAFDEECTEDSSLNKSSVIDQKEEWLKWWKWTFYMKVLR